jgi:hypothetical protein
MLKLSVTRAVWALVLSLAFWSLYWMSSGERPEPEETAVLVGIALLLVMGGAAIRARWWRAGERKRE